MKADHLVCNCLGVCLVLLMMILYEKNTCFAQQQQQQQFTLFLDPNSINNVINSNCLEATIPCSNFEEIIQATRNLLNETNKLDNLQVVVRIRGEITTCDHVINFSQFTRNFKLSLVAWDANNKFSIAPPPRCVFLDEDSSKINELYLENGNFKEVDLPNLEIDLISIVNSTGIMFFNTRGFSCDNSRITIGVKNSENIRINHSNIQLDCKSGSKFNDFLVENSILIMSDTEISNFNTFTIRNSLWELEEINIIYTIRLNIGAYVSITDCEIIGSNAMFENIDVLEMGRIKSRERLYVTDDDIRVTIFTLFNIRNIKVASSNFTENNFAGSVFDIQGCYQVEFIECNFYNNLQKEFMKVRAIEETELSISDSKFFDNRISNAIINQESHSGQPLVLYITNCEFIRNYGGSTGSVLNLYLSDVYITTSSFSHNMAIKGGVIYGFNTRNLVFTNSNFTNNESDYGGAIYLGYSRFTHGNFLNLINSLCDGNFANIAGGCLFSNDEYDLNMKTIKGVNRAGFYGNIVASALVGLILELEDKDGKYQTVTNQTINVFPGEYLNFRIILYDMYNQKTSKLSDGDLLISLEESQSFVMQSQNFANGNESILLSNTQILLKNSKDIVNSSTHLRLNVLDMKRIIQLNIVECPIGYSMSRNYGTFKCEIIPLQIIIPSAILGSISLIIISISLIIGSVYIIRKLRKLRKQERAEMEIQKKFTDNSFVFHNSNSDVLSELHVPLIESSKSNQSAYQYTIPISDIKIISKIGEGTNGIVYKGKWQRTDVAIKQLKSGGEDSEEFEREAILMSSLRHPSIVSCFGVSLTLNSKYMVVEYLENGSLDKALYNSRIGREKLLFETKLNILFDVAKGMNYLHSINPNKIIHRDLKPGNILLTKNMNAKVGDFGLSKIVSNNTATMTTNVGTLLYIAPELLSSYHKGQTTKLDVYSFGIIMWEILFEMIPFSNELSDVNTPFAILLKVITGYRPSVSLIGDNFENISEFIQGNFTNKEIQRFGTELISNCLREYIELMKLCWHTNPNERPEFNQITASLESVIDLLTEN